MSASATTISPDVPEDVYTFVKYFVDSAERELKALSEPSTAAELLAKSALATVSILSYSGVESASGTSQTYPDKENLQKLKKIKNALSGDSSLHFEDRFKTVFISAAIEIYYAFKFQLQNVYLVTKDSKDKSLALEILGAYAGERCFEQLLTTGVSENLHRILVPSINKKKGYDFEGEAKTTWETLKNVGDIAIIEITSLVKAKETEKLLLSIGNVFECEVTAASFFDDCIPGYDPCDSEINTKLKEKKLTWTCDSIFVHKTKKGKSFFGTAKEEKKPKVESYLYRSPFKVEAEKIKSENLELMKISPSEFGRVPHDFECKDYSHLTFSIFQKLNLDHDDDYCTPLIAITQTEDKNLLSRVSFQVQEPPESFVGRKKVLDEIKKNIDDQKHKNVQPTLISQTHIISGRDGVGKTTSANEFIRIFEKKNPSSNVVFIHAETHKSLIEDFTNLSLYLGILQNGNDFNWEKVKTTLYNRLLCDRKCLIIFDNAQSLKDEKPTNNGIEKFLPSLPHEFIKNFSILFTTRNHDSISWGNREPILLNVFEDNEAIQFVKNIIGEDKESEEDIKQVVKLCGNLPLALKLTTAFIKQKNTKFGSGSGYTLTQFLDEEKIKIFLDNENKKKNILFYALDLSLANIIKFEKGELALLILRIMAFNLRPDMIYSKYFEVLFLEVETKESLDEALGLLGKYSLVSKFTGPKENPYYSIHRTIQMITKEKLVGNIQDSSKFIISLVSNLSHIQIQCKVTSIEPIPALIRNVFNWISNVWEAEDAWNLAKEIVSFVMGKENADCDSNLMLKVHDITLNYLSPVAKCKKFSSERNELICTLFEGEDRLFWNYPECLTGQSESDLSLLENFNKTLETPYTQPKYRLVFCTSELWDEFKQKVRALYLDPENEKIIVNKAEDYFKKIGYNPSKILNPNTESSKVLLTVFIEKVETSSDSGVWIFDSRDKHIPKKELCGCGWDEKDSKIVFFLLSSESSKIFISLLGIIYSSFLYWITPEMCHFISLNILVPIVSKAKFENDVNTIQSLIGLIGKTETELDRILTGISNQATNKSKDNSSRRSSLILTLSKGNAKLSERERTFMRSFVVSAVEALQSLEKKVASVLTHSQAIDEAYDDEQVAVISLRNEIWKKINAYNVENCLPIDSSQTFLDVFQKVFDTSAREIYNAFRFQLEDVYLTVGISEDPLEALRQLGRYAGQKCFQQLLKTGSPENLHLILVPSITRSSGYKFEDEITTNWDSLRYLKHMDISSWIEAHIANTPWFFHERKTTEYKTTAAEFFDSKIPVFYTHIPAIKKKLEKQDVTWMIGSIVLDKTKTNRTDLESIRPYLFRSPFKLEAEKIRADNLLFVENGFLGLNPKEFTYTILDLDCVINKLLLETWELSSSSADIPKGELAMLILQWMTFSPVDVDIKVFKDFFCRSETVDALKEAFELLVKYGLFINYKNPIGRSEMCYSISPMVSWLNYGSIIRNTKDIAKMFFFIASAFNFSLRISDKYFLSESVDNLFFLVELFWNGKYDWDSAQEIVRTLMGKDHLDSSYILPFVHNIVTKYTRTFRGSIDKPIRNLYFTPVKKRVLFLISKTLKDFKTKAQVLCLSEKTVQRAEKSFGRIDKIYNYVELPIVLLAVFIEKEENACHSRVWVVNSKEEDQPDEDDLGNLNWDDEDAQISFLILPSQYFGMFSLLLEEIFISASTRAPLHYFIGAIILAEIVMSTNDPHAIDTIHSLMAFIGARGGNTFPGGNSYRLKLEAKHSSSR